MQSPWHDLTGWKKALAVFAAMLIVSLGLCGTNYLAFSHFNLPVGGGTVAGQESKERLAGILIISGALEVIAIAVSLLGVLVSLVGLALHSIVRAIRTLTPPEQP